MPNNYDDGRALSIMTLVLASQFQIYLLWDNAPLAKCLNSILNVKALVGAFNQEKALEGTSTL